MGYIYNYDLGKLFVWVLRNYEEVDPIILTGDEEAELSITDTAKLVLKAFDYKGEVKYDASKSDGQLRKTASNAKLRRYLPDFKFTPMAVAIPEVVQWFKDNYDIARK